jgi:hypothetical protein
VLLAAAARGIAQEVKSRPVGFLTLTVPAGQTRSFSIPFDAAVSSRQASSGRLTGVGTNFLEVATANWSPGVFSKVAEPYFVRLISGSHAGRVLRIVQPDNTATRLYVAADETGDLTTLDLAVGVNGTAFEIILGDTLATFFGPATVGGQPVVQGAANPNGADIVQLWGGAAWLNFYYNTTWKRWARDTDIEDTAVNPSRDHVLLRGDRGMMITRRGTTDLVLSLEGRVLVTPQRSAHARSGAALTFLATMQPTDTTLGELALQSQSRSVAWRSAANPTEADQVLVWNGAAWYAFFFNSTAGHWQLSGDPTNRDAYVIRAGTPVFVQRMTEAHSAADKTLTFPAPGN